MRILDIDKTPLDGIGYVNAGRRGGVTPDWLPLLRGVVDRLPGDLLALLCASDLQGVAPSAVAGGALVLLGRALAERMEERADQGDLPPSGRIGVLLAGDLYSAPAGDVRGATGDVRGVWQAFARGHRWVAGVGGNHDLFGHPGEAWRFAAEPGIHLLDGALAELDGLRLGGVSGIIGDPRKPGRRDAETFYRLLGRVLDDRPEVLVLHEGPDVPGQGRRGNPEVREMIEAGGGRGLVVCGHCHWEHPLAELADGTQVLNVDARAVVLQAAEPRRSSSGEGCL